MGYIVHMDMYPLGRASSHFLGPIEQSQAWLFALDYGDGPDDHQGSSS